MVKTLENWNVENRYPVMMGAVRQALYRIGGRFVKQHYYNPPAAGWHGYYTLPGFGIIGFFDANRTSFKWY